MSNPIAAVILAAGKGTRMKSDLHKVLHPIAGRAMLMHLTASVDALAPAKKVVVVGSGKEQLESALAGAADLAVQEPQLGTGHAVQMAEAALDLLVQTLDEVLAALKPWLEDASMAKLGQNIKYDLHVLANAGITVFGSFLDYEPAAFDRVTSVNLRGSFFTAQAAARAEKADAKAGA